MSKFNVGDDPYHATMDENGNVHICHECFDNQRHDVGVLWRQRDELLEVVRDFVQTMDSLPDSDETSLRVWDVYDAASKLIKAMQQGES